MVNCGKSFYTKRQCNLKYPNLFHCDKKWQMQCLFDFGAYLQVTHFSFLGFITMIITESHFQLYFLIVCLE